MKTGILLGIGVVLLAQLFALVDNLSFPDALLVSVSIWQLGLVLCILKHLERKT